MLCLQQEQAEIELGRLDHVLAIFHTLRQSAVQFESFFFLSLALFQQLGFAPQGVHLVGDAVLVEEVHRAADSFPCAVAQQDAQFQNIHAQVAAIQLQGAVDRVESVTILSQVEAYLRQKVEAVIAAGKDIGQGLKNGGGTLKIADTAPKAARMGQHLGIVGGDGKGFLIFGDGLLLLTHVDKAAALHLDLLGEGGDALGGLVRTVGGHYPQKGLCLLQMGQGGSIVPHGVGGLGVEVVVVVPILVAGADPLTQGQGILIAVVLEIAPRQLCQNHIVLGVRLEMGFPLGNEGFVPFLHHFSQLKNPLLIAACSIHQAKYLFFRLLKAVLLRQALSQQFPCLHCLGAQGQHMAGVFFRLCPVACVHALRCPFQHQFAVIGIAFS